ncbi:hypothetical protein [Gemmatimonas sp.]
MRRPRRSVALLLAALPGAAVLPAGRAAAQSLTLPQVVQSGAITGSTPGPVVWAPDSRTMAFVWDSTGGNGTRDVWLVSADGRTRRALSLAAEGAPAARGAAVREIVWRADSRALYLLRGELLLRATLADAPAGRVALDTMAVVATDARELALSPTGDRAAYVRNGDVWTVSLTAPRATPAPLTRVSVPSIATVPLGTYARLDREIGSGTWGTAAPSFAWAPDGRTLAVQLVDRRAVRTVPFPYYLGADTQLNQLRR